MTRKILIPLFLLIVLAACAQKKQPVSAGDEIQGERDGSSYEKAIIIRQETEKAGVDAEYVWIGAKYPGYKMLGQSLTQKDGKPYDILDIKTASGEKVTVYFDISNFFGKW